MSDRKRAMQELIDDVPCWEVWDVVKDVLERAALKGDDGMHTPMPDASGRWVWAVACALTSRANLLEYGVSLKWPWLTPDGKRLLDWLRAFGTDDEKWPTEGDDGRWYLDGLPTARDWNQP